VKRILITALLTAAALLSCAGAAYAEDDGSDITVYTQREYIEIALTDEGGADIGIGFYDPVYDRAYAPMKLMEELTGLYISEEYDAANGTYTAQGEGLEFKAVRGKSYITVNGRYVYSPEDYVIVSDEIMFSLDVLCKTFGYEQEIIEATGEIVLTDLETGIITVGDKGDKYYILTYGNDNVKWLQRIIQAEAEGEKLAGKIGVGNVILNRVKDIYFPNNIHDVIFHVDVDGTVQFETTVTGGINVPPSEEAKIAAYLCLEGANTVGESEFFIEPDKGDDSWFSKYLTFIVSIGGHDFYADPRRLS